MTFHWSFKFFYFIFIWRIIALQYWVVSAIPPQESAICCSIVTKSLGLHGQQHTRLPCPSPYAGVCSNSCPLSQWCHPTISSSVVPFSSCPQSFPASGSFPMSWLFKWTKYWSFSFSISLSNEYSELIFSRIDWFDLLPVQGTLKSLLQHHNLKAPVFWHSAFFMVQLSNLYTTVGKNHGFDYTDICRLRDISAF